jgi:hypothetical protein
MNRILASLCAATLFAGASGASADPNGVPMCTAAGDQTMPVIVADGLGGAIIVWHDTRPGSPAGGLCYAQRVDSTGAPMWAADGVPLCTGGDVNDPVIVGDGAGAAYIGFGGQGTAPRAQYINPGGVVQWGADGVTLSTGTTQARDLAIARDFGGMGDILVAWRQDNGNGGSSDIFGQKLSSTGVVQWNPGGQALETSINNEMLPAVISDGAGGAVLAWVDASSNNVKAMGFKSNAVGSWPRVPLSASTNNQPLSIVPDCSGGAIVGWAGGGSYVQRVTGSGVRLWGTPSTGVLLSSGGHQTVLLGDGQGGAIAAWEDYRSGTNYNIYAQGLLSTGAPVWALNGAEVCTATQDQRLPQIVSDGNGGAIITWFDYRTSNATGSDIYAQRMVAGAPQWLTDGIPVCTAPDNQEYPTITSDKEVGAFIVWQDHRSGTDYDIYLQRVGPDAATLSAPPASAEAPGLRAWPNPFSDRVQMPFTLSAPAEVRMSVVDVGGRIVRDLGSAWMAGGAHRLQWDGMTSAGARAAPGLYFLRVSGPGLTLSRPVVRVQ